MKKKHTISIKVELYSYMFDFKKQITRLLTLVRSWGPAFFVSLRTRTTDHYNTIEEQKRKGHRIQLQQGEQHWLLKSVRHSATTSVVLFVRSRQKLGNLHENLHINICKRVIKNNSKALQSFRTIGPDVHLQWRHNRRQTLWHKDSLSYLAKLTVLAPKVISLWPDFNLMKELLLSDERHVRAGVKKFK